MDPVRITAAVVDVPGCSDGHDVGLQLITDDGDVPAEPLFEEAHDGQVRFDLSALHLPFEPVTGVRVLLHHDVVELLDITVQQRFFSPAGNEQRGLRAVTELEVAVGQRYRVPDAPARYETADCTDLVDLDELEQAVAHGAGESFTATVAGVHIACYQQVPGTPGGPPDVEDPVVDDSVAVLGAQASPDRDHAAGGPLATTGANLTLLLAAALGSIIVGRRLLRSRSRG